MESSRTHSRASKGDRKGNSSHRVWSSGLAFWRKVQRLGMTTLFREGKSWRTAKQTEEGKQDTKNTVERPQGSVKVCCGCWPSMRKRRPMGRGISLRSSTRTSALVGPRRRVPVQTSTNSSGTAVLEEWPVSAPSTHSARAGEPEPGRGLEVLQVVLSHAKLGQPWYVSMRELQLACVDTCLACRRRSKWNVRVTTETPEHLWLRSERDRYRRRDIVLRVPLLRVYSITWDAPAAARISRGSTLFEPEPSQEGEVRKVSTEWWPRTLREMTFGNEFNATVDGVLWPDALKQLTFGRKFNQEIGSIGWPRRLVTLTFGSFFDQPIEGTELPDSLQYLSFGVSFNQAVEDVSWSASLRELSFGHRFNQPIERVLWPDSLRCLKFGWEFNTAISRVQWPPRLESIVFGGCFNKRINEKTLPKSLRLIRVGRTYSQPVDSVIRSGIRVQRRRESTRRSLHRNVCRPYEE
ncbi:unnamed protein product [Ascophyllum nodosum]